MESRYVYIGRLVVGKTSRYTRTWNSPSHPVILSESQTKDYVFTHLCQVAWTYSQQTGWTDEVHTGREFIFSRKHKNKKHRVVLSGVAAGPNDSRVTAKHSLQYGSNYQKDRPTRSHAGLQVACPRLSFLQLCSEKRSIKKRRVFDGRERAQWP